MNPEKRKMVFMGSDPIALPGLREIVEHWSGQVQIIACYTQPDRRTGRGRKVKANAIKLWAQEQGIPVKQPERLGEEDVAFLREVECDLVLVMAYGHILRKRFLETPPLGTFNLHASILPRYRGAAPLNAAIAAGDDETGVTLMRMVRRLDAGPVADIERFPLDRLETGESIIPKAASACVPLLQRNLAAMLSGEVALREQSEPEATFTRKLEKSDGVLDFSAPARVLVCRINALHPWPAVAIEINGETIRFGLADFQDGDRGEPGEIIANEDVLAVATGEGTLEVLRLQRPGGRMLEAKAFLRGFRVERGYRLPSAPMPDLVADEPFPWKTQGSDSSTGAT